MRVEAEHDNLLLKRLPNKKTGQFIEAGANDKSPFFEIVSCGPGSSYDEGDIVVPHPEKLIPIELAEGLHYFVDEKDVLGTGEEAKRGRS